MADTLKGRLLYVCATPQPDDLDQSDFEALTWVQVKHVGSVGETGTKDNIVSYDEMDTDVLQKQKGISNAGDPPVEVAHSPTDPGQILMRAAGVTHESYAFKVVDGETLSGYTPTIYYLRGLVGGPTKPNGRQENFNLEVYMLGILQREIIVDPVPQSAPAVTYGPAIWSTDGTPDVSSSALLRARPGEYTNGPYTLTYKWQRDAAGNGVFVDIGGATNITYDAVAGDLGNAIRVVETATNDAGNVSSNSMSTKVTIA